MAALAPSGGVKILVEFVAGTWTDISQYFDNTQDIVIQYGRTSEYSKPQTASLSFLLDNTDGRFTPDRQLLADNVTVHPYYPNVELRKRVQIQFVQSGTYNAFTGYIKGWVPVVDPSNGFKVTVSAATREDKLNGVILKTPLQQEMTADVPVAFWPLDDVSGSTTAVDVVAVKNMSLVTSGTGGGLSFGSDSMSSSEDSTITLTAGASNTGGQYLASAPAVWIPPVATSTSPISYCVETWFKTSDLNGGNIQYLWSLPSTTATGFAQFDGLSLDGSGNLNYQGAGIVGALVSTIGNLADGNWHHVVTVFVQGGASGFWIYVDGVVAGVSGRLGTTFSGAATPLILGNLFGAWPNSDIMFRGQLGPTAIYVASASTPALPVTRIANHAAAGLGFVGDTTGARIARYLGYAGLTSANWNLDAGQAIVGPYATDQQSVIAACQAMTDTEGGGACIYQTPDGLMRFPDRTFQKPGTPTLTFDALADMDGPSFTPTKDDSDVINQSVATQSSGANSGASFTATNADSVLLYGLVGDSVTSYAVSSGDVLNLAQSHIAAAWHPVRDTHARRSKGRLQSVTLDVYTSTTAGLYDLISSVQIGSRIRIINLPSHFPTTQIDVIVEGWTVTINVDKFTIAWVTSAADNPTRMLWSDPLGLYSLWGPDPGSQTTALATAATSTLVVTTAAGHPTFSAVSGDYPLSVQVGEEVIKLPTAPSGSTSPQTFTGILRGQQGTQAAPQGAASPINVWPSATWTL